MQMLTAVTQMGSVPNCDDNGNDTRINKLPVAVAITA